MPLRVLASAEDSARLLAGLPLFAGRFAKPIVSSCALPHYQLVLNTHEPFTAEADAGAGRRIVATGGGRLILWPPTSVSMSWERGTTDTLWLNLDLPVSIPGREEFQDELLRGMMVEASQAARDGDRLYASTLIQAIGGRLLRLARPQDPPPIASPIGDRATAMATDYIRGHSADNPTIEELANLVGVSPFHFLRHFHRTVGVTPHQYLIRCRCEAARDMILAHPEIDLAAVAQICGFADQSHMGRHFKRAFGVTPARARAEQLRSKRQQDCSSKIVPKN